MERHGDMNTEKVLKWNNLVMANDDQYHAKTTHCKALLYLADSLGPTTFAYNLNTNTHFLRILQSEPTQLCKDSVEYLFCIQSKNYLKCKLDYRSDTIGKFLRPRSHTVKTLVKLHFTDVKWNCLMQKRKRKKS
jgi:hypothetical protein